MGDISPQASSRAMILKVNPEVAYTTFKVLKIESEGDNQPAFTVPWRWSTVDLFSTDL